MPRPSRIPAGQYVPTADQRVLIHAVPWSHFDAMLRIRGDAPVPRIAYWNGVLELMSPSKHHERIKSYIGRLLEAYALDAGFEFSPYGGWTLRNEPGQAGAEPDECYIVGLDQDREIPDLVIEVEWTAGGLDKLAIYSSLGIPEFWRWKDNRIEIRLLRRGRYQLVDRSALFPDLDVGGLIAFLEHPTASQAIRAFRQHLATGKPLRRPRSRRR